MAKKVVLFNDPGIDGAFAVTLALLDPALEVEGLIATAGNVGAEAAVRNLHFILEQVDPPRWPRLGSALVLDTDAVDLDLPVTRLHGPSGLGELEVPDARLHAPLTADKVLGELARQFPRELTIVLLGPATAFARAMDVDAELATLVERVVFVGGSWHEPGDATAVSEFHFYADPAAARKVLRSGIPVTLLPLDVSHKIVLSPSELLNLPNPESGASRFLRQIVPWGIRETASLFGTEGLHLHDVAGVVALAQPDVIQAQPAVIDVETRGELTRGMSVREGRWGQAAKPNVELGVGVHVKLVRDYIQRVLGGTARD